MNGSRFLLRKETDDMNFIEYVKQLWKNGPGGGTPWSAARLNHMEDGIKNNNSMISELNNNISNFYCYGLDNLNNKQIIRVNRQESDQFIFYALCGASGTEAFGIAYVLAQSNKVYSTNLRASSATLVISVNESKTNQLVFNMHGNWGRGIFISYLPFTVTVD